MATIEKNKVLNGAVKKLLTRKQKEIIESIKEGQKIMTRLYKEGKVDIYDPIR